MHTSVREAHLTQIRISIPAPTTTRALAARERARKATNSAAFLPSAIEGGSSQSLQVILLLFSCCHNHRKSPLPPQHSPLTSAVLPSRFSAACLHSRQISSPKLRLINCDPSHLSLPSLLSLPPTLAQRPNRLPISYRRARRLGLLQTLSLKNTLIHHHRHHQARLLPAIRSPLLLLLLRS